MKVVRKKIESPKPDLWKYKEAEAEHFIEKFEKEKYTTLEFSNKYIGVVYKGDLHFGNKGVSYKTAREHAELIAETPDCYINLAGDNIDNFVKTKIISAIVNKNTSPTEEIALFEKYLDFCNESVILAVRGNHDAWMKEISGIDIFKKIFKKRQIVYSDDEHRITMKVGKNSYKIGIRHKYRLNSSFNMTHCVKQWLRLGEWEFDVGVIAHHHEYVIEEFTYRQTPRIAIRTGSYKVSDTFAQSLGYNAAKPIMPMVVYSPNDWGMRPFSSIKEGIEYLKFKNGVSK